MYAPGKRHTINTDEKRMFSMRAWLLIILGIAFMVYAFTPPVRNAVNSTIADIVGPLLDLSDNIMKTMKYIN